MGFLRRSWPWLVVVLVCAGFLLYQLPLMHLPAYWDEAFPYSYAVFHMFGNGPTLIPTDEGMPSQLFTGHPPLFYFLEACWMKIAGEDVFSQRILPVALSIGSILLLFNIGRRHFSPEAGVLAAIIFATRAVFLAQASRVLPETMVVFFMLLALEFWLSRKFWLYILPASCMLLTKEPSLTFIPLLCLWGLLREWQGGVKFWENFKPHFKVQFRSAFFTCLPVLLAASFFVAQYFLKGWFFFPRHMQMSLPADAIWWRMTARFDEFFNRFGGYLLPIVSGVCIIFMIILRSRPGREKIIALAMMLLFVFGNIWFSSLNYYATTRYILFITPMIALFGAVLISHAYPRHKLTGLLVGLVIGGVQLTGNYLEEDMGDSSRGYITRIRAMQQCVSWMAEHKLYEKNLWARFLTLWSINDFPPGYVKPEHEARSISGLPTDSTEYYIHWEIDGQLSPELDTIPHKQIAWFQDGPGWVAVYRIHPERDSIQQAKVDSLQSL